MTNNKIMTTQTFSITGMHCTSCALNIDFDVEELKGVKESKTHYAKSQTTVTYDETLLSEEDILAVIKKLGYEAHA